MRRENFGRIAIFSNEVDAQLALATLTAANIYAYIDADDAGGMIPSMEAYRGVGVYVEDKAIEEARTVLGTTAEPAPDSGSDAGLDASIGGLNLGPSEI